MENAVDILSGLEELADEMYQGKIVNFILGDRNSGIVGDGYDLFEMAEWEQGDPFDSIDWRQTLITWPDKIIKTNRIETKELPLVMAVDATPSMLIRFADNESKFRLMLQLMGVLGFSAVHSHDPISITSFSNPNHFFLPPRYGKGNIFNAAEILLDDAGDFYAAFVKNKQIPKSYSSAIDINECLSEILDRVKNQSLVVVVSDFIGDIYGHSRLDESLVSSLVARHKGNVIFVILNDEYEFSWSGGAGTIMTKNIDTGQLREMKVNSSADIRSEHSRRQSEFKKHLENLGIDSLVLSTHDWFDKLSEFAVGRQDS